MKIKIYIVLLFTLVISSCELEEEIFSTVAPETAFLSESDAEAGLAGAYINLSSFAGYKDRTFQTLAALNDGIVGVGGTGAGLLSNKTASASEVRIRDPWSMYFRTINNAFLVLDNVPAIEMDPETQTRILGEAHFIVGFSYFNLVRMFGKAPIRTRAIVDDSDVYLPLSSREQVYATIIEHLLQAEEMCISKFEQPADELGRATKGAVQALLADVYLTQEDWANAKTYADKVINSGEYTLMSNYADLWDVNMEEAAETSEIIFSIQFKRDPNNTGFFALGNSFVFNTNPNTGTFTGNGNGGGGSGGLRVQKWFYDICTTGDYTDDYRSEVSFLTEYTNRNNGNPVLLYPNNNQENYSTKYQDPQGLDNRNHENDLYIYRLAEIYLIKAEAENELGNTAGAYAAFNELRARARLADGTARTTPADLTPGLNKDDFREAVFTERGVEQNFELKRWFDLIRMKRGNGDTYFTYMYRDFIPTLPADKKNEPHLTYDPKYELLAIPTLEILNNPNITAGEQNPGW
ncbi:MAG: RagB/SusD family nutrient uptake outer membrane protein [Bacteroidota bacterium]